MISNKVIQGLKYISKQSINQKSGGKIDVRGDEERLSKKWNKFLKFLNSSVELEEEINKEKMALTEAILEVKSLIPIELL